jgi:hypothetical protein
LFEDLSCLDEDGLPAGSERLDERLVNWLDKVFSFNAKCLDEDG